jgi:uncharacterized protein
MLLYIHGFNSSPHSDKGVATAHYLRHVHPDENLYQPQLPSHPQETMALLCARVEQALSQGESLCYIGSSLGGYYASYLAQTYGGKAALINPAVRPYELFDDYLGWQHNPYTQEHYRITQADKQALQEYDTRAIANPDRFLVLLQTGDEVLDYRQALSKYQACQLLIQSGGDHGFVGYEQQLPSICRFLQLP